MSLFSNVLGGLGKVASVAAPFIPGVGGAIAGLVGGLSAQGQSQKKADQYTGQLSNLASQQAGAYTQYNPLVISSLLSSAGVDPKTGAYDPSANPYSMLADRLYSDSSINSRAAQLFSPGQLQGDIAANREATGQNFDNAVNATKADLLDRGFVGANNAMLDANVGAIRRAQAESNAQYGQSLISRLLQQRQQYVASQQGQGQALRAQGIGQGIDTLGRVGGLLSGSASQGTGTLGGLQGMYASQADAAGKGVAGALGDIAQSGIFGNILKKKGTSAPPVFTPKIAPSAAPTLGGTLATTGVRY